MGRFHWRELLSKVVGKFVRLQFTALHDVFIF
jgi:hypothetical protein